MKPILPPFVLNKIINLKDEKNEKSVLFLSIIFTTYIVHLNANQLLCKGNYFLQISEIDQKVEKMNEVVTLTVEQKTKYKNLLIKTDVQKKELTEKAKSVSPEEKKKMQGDFKKGYEAELKKILTTKQFKKLGEAKNKKQ